MKLKTITLKLDEDTHRILKSEAVLSSEKLPDFAKKIIQKALKEKKVFN
jgi:hypothetical protein